MHLLANIQSNIPTIIVSVIVVIAGAIAAYFIIRMMKGKIEITLPKSGYNSGEEVKGSITLTTRKSLQLNRLYVALIGYQIIDRVDHDGDRKTRKNEIYRNEINILEAQMVPAGTAQAYEFNMVAPGNQSSAGGTELEGKMASVVGSAAQALGALGALGGNSRRLEWKLEARADLPGVDIAKSHKLRINLM